MIDDYLAVLDRQQAKLPEGYHGVVEAAQPLRAALDANPLPLAPCHCDPLCENFLDDGRRMWIVDWEYSGMNDPLWDLGDVSVEAGFDAAQDREMRSEEHTSELQSLMRISYAVFCLKKKTNKRINNW